MYYIEYKVNDLIGWEKILSYEKLDTMVKNVLATLRERHPSEKLRLVKVIA